MTAKINALIEKLFVMLLAGACGFVVTYLRDINKSLDAIRDKMGIACEQISVIESGMNEVKAELTYQKDIIDMLHPRKG